MSKPENFNDFNVLFSFPDDVVKKIEDAVTSLLNLSPEEPVTSMPLYLPTTPLPHL